MLMPSLLTMALAIAGPVAQIPKSSETAVSAVLDDWHLAAAQADEARYFGHLREGAVFLGTDATERWTKVEFQVWAHPFFKRGKAWAFKAKKRSIAFSVDGKSAWFDEDLDTPNLGPARGSGILVQEQDRWRIAQYNLSVPIPNPLMDRVKAQIETHLKQAATK
ncbi:MAG: nuclear transport factor 2 family protein [Holophaga sp.]|nr:nuclear transport factor 2 family protein [Holophaga sp.]